MRDIKSEEILPITFERMSKNQDDDSIRFLYKLLQNRKYSISHSEMPSFEEHKSFVANHPYHSWYLINLGRCRIGSIYFGFDNSVGLHMLSEFECYLSKVLIEFEKSFSPLPAVKSKVCKFFFFNIAPENQLMQKALEELGYQVTQVAYTRLN